MIRRRWRLLLALTLLVLVGGLALVPGVRWPVYGWLRGEAFYQGMPTSWWASEVEESHFPLYGPSSYRELEDPHATELESVPLFGWYRTVLPSPGEWFKQWLTATPRGASWDADETYLGNGDAAAVPVLLQLLHSGLPKVRRLAIFGLGRQTSLPPEALAAIRAVAGDPDERMARDTRLLLERIDSEAAAKAGVK